MPRFTGAWSIALASVVLTATGSMVAAEPSWTPITFERGAVDLCGGDAITITNVWGNRATFEAGGTYRVKGTYRLASATGGTMLFSLTTADPSGKLTQPGSQITVDRGDGTFDLTETFDARGYPHVSFYGADGYGMGGVYFGSGDWLLKKIPWSSRRSRSGCK
jgi:hypothetical protein